MRASWASASQSSPEPGMATGIGSRSARLSTSPSGYCLRVQALVVPSSSTISRWYLPRPRRRLPALPGIRPQDPQAQTQLHGHAQGHVAAMIMHGYVVEIHVMRLMHARGCRIPTVSRRNQRCQGGPRHRLLCSPAAYWLTEGKSMRREGLR